MTHGRPRLREAAGSTDALEGRWLAPYYDGAGNLIVVADDRGEEASTDRERVTVLESDVRRVASHLEDRLPVVGRLDAVRQRVLIHMAFNMGVTQLLTLTRFISAVQFRNWEAAAKEMLILGLGETRTAAGQRVGPDDADGTG